MNGAGCRVTRAVGILTLCLVAAGCGGSSETRETDSVSVPAANGQGLAIGFRSEPGKVTAEVE